jgi:hypothetical protein
MMPTKMNALSSRSSALMTRTAPGHLLILSGGHFAFKDAVLLMVALKQVRKNDCVLRSKGKPKYYFIWAVGTLIRDRKVLTNTPSVTYHSKAKGLCIPYVYANMTLSACPIKTQAKLVEHQISCVLVHNYQHLEYSLVRVRI